VGRGFFVLLMSGLLAGSFVSSGHAQVKTADAQAARAVAVVEFTGTLEKPERSRLIPITFWDGQQYQDAGVYMARPAPLALDRGVEYELEAAGTPKSFYDLRETGSVDNPQSGPVWFGYGTWRPYILSAAPRPGRRGRLPDVVGNSDDGRPHLKRRPDSEETGAGPTTPTAPARAEEKPTLKRRSDASDTGEATSERDAAVSPQVVEQDHREHPDTTAQDANSTNSTNSANSSEDNKKDKKKKYKPAKDVATVRAVDTEDEDRPHLRKNPLGDTDKFEATRLTGSSEDVVQMVAVSDAQRLDLRAFGFGWPDEATRQQIRAQLEAVARKALGVDANAAPPQKTSILTRGKVIQNPGPPPVAPEYKEDDFRAFDLQQTGQPTLVYSAHVENGEGNQRGLTLIAQVGEEDKVLVLSQSAFESAHLADSPWMKLVDAVDADGDNRAELLFELRSGGNTRSFALWKIRRGSAAEVFRSGEMP
jgi:hypothetical protein